MKKILMYENSNGTWVTGVVDEETDSLIDSTFLIVEDAKAAIAVVNAWFHVYKDDGIGFFTSSVRHYNKAFNIVKGMA